MALRTLPEDFQNQQSTVIDRHVKTALKVTLLSWAKRLIEQDLSRSGLQRQRLDLFGLSRANKQRSIGRTPLASHPGHRSQARRLRQQTKLLQLRIEVRQAQVDAHQKDWGRRP